MRIAHFISNALKNEKSAVYVKSMIAYNLCLNLVQRGHDVRIFTSSEDRKDYIDTYKGIVIHRYGSFLRYRSEHVSPGILYKPLNYDLDVVHVHSGISISLIAGFRYAMKKKRPLVITWHGDSIREYGRYSGVIPGVTAYFYKKYLADKLLFRADVIISPSEYYIEKSRFLGRYKDKIAVIPNGINLEEFDIPHSKEECKTKLGLSGKNMVLFVGGLYPLKGPHVLLKAIPKIVKEHKDTIFVFAGSGDINKYKKLSEEMGVQKYVRFTRYISEEKTFYYRASDIFVLPSLTESFGIVNLEAMACGVPIVASNVGGVPDVVKNGENGLLVPPKDPEALAAALIYLLENGTVRKKMGKNARKKAEDYSWERIAEETEKVYKELIDEKD